MFYILKNKLFKYLNKFSVQECTLLVYHPLHHCALNAQLFEMKIKTYITAVFIVVFVFIADIVVAVVVVGCR